MRIGRADFEVGNTGRVHQAVLDAVPVEEAVDESELRDAYDRTVQDSKPDFAEVLENLSHFIVSRRIGDRVFYIQRKAWLSSAEVARLLGVSKRTVQSWGQHGRLFGHRCGGRLRFAADAVEEWVRGIRYSAQGTQPGNAVVDEVWSNEKDAEYDRV
ncbi:MAG: helix-turn-helix domain-containing protein [Dehalococcoidia bacterium]